MLIVLFLRQGSKIVFCFIRGKELYTEWVVLDRLGGVWFVQGNKHI